MKILYVHGYMGNGNGNASRLIKNELKKRNIECTVDAPQFNVTEPEKIIDELSKIIEKEKYDCVTASSMGAFYLLMVKAPFKILVNPALPVNLKAIRDENPAENPKLTDEMLGKMKICKDYYFTIMYKTEDFSKMQFVFGTEDTVAPNEKFFRYYFGEENISIVKMEHRLNQTGAEKVCDIIEKQLVK